MKIFSWTLLFFLIAYALQAQQVTKVDCCLNFGTKATIIINDNTTSNTTNSSSSNTATVSNNFNFTLSTSANTSAGVFNSTGNLLRTLWSGVHYDAGCYVGQWDGLLDDFQTPAPFGDYTIKVLTNNVQYNWLGVIGNIESSFQDNEYTVGNGFFGISATNGYIYFARGVSERDVKHSKAALNNLGAMVQVFPGNTSMNCSTTCTDGVNTYWAGSDDYVSGDQSTVRPYFIFATKVSDDSQVIFSSGTQHTINFDGGKNYQSCLGTEYGTSAEVQGLSVNGDYLFVARPNLNKVEVFDKKTGALVQSSAITAPISLACTNDNKVWISTGANATNPTPVKQYIVGLNGILTPTGVSVPAGNMNSIAVSPVTGELAVADNDNSQVRFYNSFGVQTHVLGQLGGYASNGAEVTYDKFKFFDNRGLVARAAITYQPDGSFWLFDAGNYRVLHFNADRTYKEQIAYVPSSRSCAVDHNTGNIFADALEYHVDYNKVATDIQHSWTLKYNWQTGTALDGYRQFEYVETLSNGHKYAAATDGNFYDLRLAGAVYLGKVYGRVEQDGSLWNRGFPNPDQAQAYKQQLTGFDGNFMPQWAAANVVATTPVIGPTSPVYYINNTTGASTNPNHYFFYDPNYAYDFGSGKKDLGALYHLGSIKAGGTTWEWQTSKGVSVNGPYPTNGYFATTGGHSENCLANVSGSNVFWHVNDELGGWTEVSRTSHFDESGLFVGHFGNDNTYEGYTGDKRFWAGNSFKSDVFTVGGRMFYIYCDESKHSGVHLTEVSNLSSIGKQTVPVTVSKAVATTADPSDLMANVPYKSDFYGGYGWTVFPAAGVNADSQYPGWRVKTGLTSYLFDDRSIDLYVDEGTNNPDNHYISRGLGTNNTNNWDLTANILVASDKGRVYFEVLDDQGKILAQLKFPSSDVVLNNVSIANAGSNYNAFVYGYENYGKMELKNTNGMVTFQYGNYPATSLNSPLDAAGNFNRPTTFRVRPFGSGAGFGSGSVKGLKFTTAK